MWPCILKFLYIKVGFEGVYFTQTCYPDVNANLYNLLLKTGDIREFWGTSSNLSLWTVFVGSVGSNRVQTVFVG